MTPVRRKRRVAMQNPLRDRRGLKPRQLAGERLWLAKAKHVARAGQHNLRGNGEFLAIVASDANGIKCVNLLGGSNRPFRSEIKADRTSNTKADVADDLSQQKQNCIRLSRMDHPAIGIENALMHHFR